jgi:peptide/nickel transport system substrate-binding protein
MDPVFFRNAARLVAVSWLWLAAIPAMADPQHGIAMYGAPALPPDFVSLPYADPDAPKGGRIVFGNTGGFDSLNPFTDKGTPPWQLRFWSYEGLMGRNYDEPFGLYGLLAESVETAEDRSWVEYTLREEARFWDGSPVTPEDVIWSFETLGTEGHLRYRGLWSRIASMEQVGARAVRITFTEADRELALIAGLRPILKKPADGADITRSGLDAAPMGSGPYRPAAYEAGRFVRFDKVPDYWGADLPIRRGTQNFDEMRIEFFADETALFEAFKAGELSIYREFNADSWAKSYDFPAVQRGDVVLSEIPHQRPSGMTGLVMNTRRAPFDDWRVRDAMLHAFNFEFINDTVTGGMQPRITSYFSNSTLAMRPGPAPDRVAALLAPFAGSLPDGALSGYALPVSDGTARNRANLRRAADLLEAAGWRVENGRRVNAEGQPLGFTILLRNSAAEMETAVDIFVRALDRLGIAARIDRVDNAQFNERTASLDFDMTDFRVGLSLSPGNEQRLYWGSAGADQPGTRNLMGVRSPAVDAMIEAILAARSNEEFLAATRALDRVLTAGRYVIPIWQYDTSRIAHAAHLRHPEALPIYGDWVDWLPDVWWSDKAR